MDQKQKRLIKSNSSQLASTFDFQEMAELLRLTKLVTGNQIDEILENAQTSYARNLKLLNALLDSDSPEAFDEFIKILDHTNNTAALQLIQPNKVEGFRSILSNMARRFKPDSNTSYPLGANSGIPTPTQSATGSHHPYQGGDNAMSPLKEKHQATLVTSKLPSFNICDSAQQTTITTSTSSSTNNSAIKNKNNNFTLENRGGFVTPPANSYQHNKVSSQNIGNTRASRSSQTPTKPAELALIHNLSLTDHEEEEEGEGAALSLEQIREGWQSENQEPLVSWHPYAQPHSLSSNQSAHRSASPHYCHPSYAGSSASSESGDSSSESLIVDPNLILDSNVTMALAKDGPNMMTVKLATVCHNDPKEHYKMTARPRGPCLIVNNIDFEGDMFPTRKGSDEDAKRFDVIFQQLGFKVIMTRNQTADQMRKLFKDVAAECKQEHDALFVFILSHGSEHGIYGVDGIEVYLESEIISCFDNRNCKAMLGKPKVFVIQACRGRAKDYGGDGDATDSIAWSVMGPTVEAASLENRVPASWLPSSQPQDGKKTKHPIRTDMLLVFSCLAGYVSVRNELAGSWLGVALAYFIMTHAHERDFERILNLVTSDVNQRESSSGHVQTTERKLLGWRKTLYFNPGIYL